MTRPDPLTRDQREAILLLAIDGALDDYTDAEIADALGCRPAQVTYFRRQEGILRRPRVAAYTSSPTRRGETAPDYS